MFPPLRVTLAAACGRITAGDERHPPAGGVAFSIVTDLADDDSLANLVARNLSEFGSIDILSTTPATRSAGRTGPTCRRADSGE